MFLLIPSPLLGPATWRPVETWLRQQGHSAEAVDLGEQPRSPAGVVDAVAAARGDRTVVLVPHSNAGLYAPHLASLGGIAATVFVDAALPGPEAEHGDTRLATPAFVDFLAGLVDDRGVLPPWTEWWGSDVDHLFSDPTARRAVEREQQRLPLTYFTSRVPVPRGWTERPAAYVAFGETYADERSRAARLGWPTRTIAGSHLHSMHDPAAVGTAILDLTRRAAEQAGAR